MILQHPGRVNRPVVTYIRSALHGNAVPPPTRDVFAKDFDAAYAIYQAFAAGGPAGVAKAFEVIAMTRPEIAELVNEEKLLIHADELKNLSAPIYLMNDYPLYSDGFNVLVGPSGSGKSFVALDISGRLAQEKPCVYVAGEGLSGYAARWEAWKDFHQVDGAELYFYAAALQVMDQNETARFIDLLAPHEPGFVVIDTLARSAIGVDENSAKEIGEFVGACDFIRNKLKCAVLVVHHTGKNGIIRGSSALYAAADSVLSVVDLGERRVLYNDNEHGGKNKHAAAADPKFFFIKPHAVGPFAGAVLVEAAKLSKDEDERINPNQRQILEALDGYEFGLNAKDVIEATNLNRSTVYRNLQLLKKQDYVTYSEDERYCLTDKGQDVLVF